MLCHLITGLRQFYNYMSSVIYYLIIGAFLATLCVYDIFMLHEHILHISFPILFLFHANYIWPFIYLYSMMSMYSYIIHVFLSLYESILLRNWNHSNWIIQTKVMAFSCQLVDLPILPRDSLHYSFSSAFTLYLKLVICTLNLRC